MSSAYEGRMRVSHLNMLFNHNITSTMAGLGLHGDGSAIEGYVSILDPETVGSYERRIEGLQETHALLQEFVEAHGVECEYETFVEVPFKGPYSPMIHELVALDVSTLQIVGANDDGVVSVAAESIPA